MENYNTILLNVDELWLKGKNRPLYYKAAKRHVKEVVKLLHTAPFQIKNDNQRLVLSSQENFCGELIPALQRIPGLFSIAPVRPVAANLEDICRAAISETEALVTRPTSFKVFTKRIDKRFPHDSMEVSRQVGGALLEKIEQLRVDVHHPELKVQIKITPEWAYVGIREFKGVGGLPFAMTGNLVTLLSGGFDSPVASYQMAKRGCRQSFVFFYAYPFVGEDVKEKIIKMSRVLASYQRESKLYVIPFGEIQKAIAKTCREEYRTILFRKLMVDAANLLADKIGADALLSGDALGQVSSQTIGNISLIDQISKRPVFRPLLGNNKAEIIALSRRIGTHDISVIPHDDACSLFAPKHPIIKPDKNYWDLYNKQNQFCDALSDALSNAEVFSFNALGK
ncbi:MAG: tRNA 4-thiouridine(8) synthase ThiI [Halobacteriovoraceae bacterium]|nr:tRNA 4-thiouridine(8) synthase ThiI [Halobacteriovoraceae bacterium]MBT5094998.1 tRNA 4-thiouridine(8) synthase ThiI [Halobacteriovoraceae bacterium]